MALLEGFDKVPELVTKKRKIPLEKSSEEKLRIAIAERGGVAYKFSSMQRRGVSDRIVFVYGMIFFVEMKREGITKLSTKQEEFRVVCKVNNVNFCLVSGHEGVVNFCDYIDKRKPFFYSLTKMVNRLYKPLSSEIFK